MNSRHQIILASNSPRRKQLLADLGFEFSVLVKDVHEEFPPHLKRSEIAEFLASQKADAYSDQIKDQILITADTIVCLGNRVLNKPSSESEAFSMLKSLSGTSHEVITGVCILSQSKKVVLHETTKVYFRELLDSEINHYISNYKPFDKAGAYGIQEWIGMIGIEKIEGSYFNVMGLPVHRVYQELQNIFATQA